jgi:hypothetical protein
MKTVKKTRLAAAAEQIVSDRTWTEQIEDKTWTDRSKQITATDLRLGTWYEERTHQNRITAVRLCWSARTWPRADYRNGRKRRALLGSPADANWQQRLAHRAGKLSDMLTEESQRQKLECSREKNQKPKWDLDWKTPSDSTLLAQKPGTNPTRK